MGLAALVAAAFAGCATGGAEPRSACLRLDADADLNLYNEQSHPVTVFVFPLSSSAVFEETPVDDLLAGVEGTGMLSRPAQLALGPGEQGRRFEKLFPGETQHLGVIADYYRAPGDPEGSRRQVVPARCSFFFTPRLHLTARDLYLD
ncbi:MAG: type VI secretion system lipoprotein TssJ [Myxococcota bacterium]